VESDRRRFFAEPPELLKRGVDFAMEALDEPKRGLRSLRGRGAPGSDDDVGGIMCDGVGNRSGPWRCIENAKACG